MTQRVDVGDVLRALEFAKRQVLRLAKQSLRFETPRPGGASPRRRPRLSPSHGSGPGGQSRNVFVARKGRRKGPWSLGVAFGEEISAGDDVLVVWHDGTEEYMGAGDVAELACPTAGQEGCLVAVERYGTLPGKPVELAGLLVRASSRWSVMKEERKVPAARAARVMQGGDRVSAFAVLEVPREVSHGCLEIETVPAVCTRVLAFAAAAGEEEARAAARDPVLGRRVVRWFECRFGDSEETRMPWEGRVVGMDPGDVDGAREGPPLYRVEYADGEGGGGELYEEARAEVMDGQLEAEQVLKARAVLGRCWARRARRATEVDGAVELGAVPQAGHDWNLRAASAPGLAWSAARAEEGRPAAGQVPGAEPALGPSATDEKTEKPPEVVCDSVRALREFFDGLDKEQVATEDEASTVAVVAECPSRFPATHLYKAQTSGLYRACRVLVPARGGVGATIKFMRCSATRANVSESLLESFDPKKRDRSWAACQEEADPERAALRRVLLDQQEVKNKESVRRARGSSSARGIKARAKRRGGLAGIKKAFEERIGKGKPRSRKGRKKRYDVITEDDTTSLVALANGYAWLRGSSQDTYESICEGYFQAMETCSPPVEALPIQWWKLAVWALRRYWRGCLSNPSNVKPLFSAVYDWGVRHGCHVNEPMPGLPMAGRKKLARFTKALAELEDEGVTRAFPIVLALFEYLLPFVDLEDPLQLQRWYAFLLAHCGMLRKNDYAEGKLAGSYISAHGTPGYDIPERECVVPPGKATAGFETVAIPGWRKLSVSLPVTPAVLSKLPMLEQLSVAVVGETYLTWLQQKYGQPLDGDIDLFPRVDEHGEVQFEESMSTQDLLAWFRGLARKAGLPEELVLSLQLHGPRAGGATDAFVRAGGNPAIIAYIKKQGRWASDCWSIYVRLRRGLVSAIFEDILSGGGLSTKERALVKQVHEQALEVTEAMFASVTDLVEEEEDEE